MFFCDSQIVPSCTRTSTPSPPVWWANVRNSAVLLRIRTLFGDFFLGIGVFLAMVWLRGMQIHRANSLSQ
jgi:hypothetical protein